MTSARPANRPSFAWLCGDPTFADAILQLRVSYQSDDLPGLPVHRAVLAAHSEYFKARLLRWAGTQGAASSQPSTTVPNIAKTGSITPKPSAKTASQIIQMMTSTWEGGGCSNAKRAQRHVPSLQDCKSSTVQDNLQCAGACNQTLPHQAMEQPGSPHPSTPFLEETFDSQAECDAAHLVVRCMYEGELAEEVKDPLTLARVCRVAERWAFPSLCSSCLQRLADLRPSQLPAEQLVLVLQTLPDSCALLPEHKKWQQLVLCRILSLFGDVHAVITNAQLREYFQQLPFAAVQQWAGSDALTVDSENSVVELISLWMAGPEGRVASQQRKQELSCLPLHVIEAAAPAQVEQMLKCLPCFCTPVAAYALGRLSSLAWFTIPGTSTSQVSYAASYGFGMDGVLGVAQAPPAWSAAPRKKLIPDELRRRTTLNWAVPRHQLADLFASKDLPTTLDSKHMYSAGVGWIFFLHLMRETQDEFGLRLNCFCQLVTYAECKHWAHSLGARLPHGTPVNLSIARGTRLQGGFVKYDHSQGIRTCMYSNGIGTGAFAVKGLRSVADLDPFLLDGFLRIDAALHVLHRPGQQ
ncbi:hypothetical protein QJQ45_028679 [Haematococcus lacustris]|nr:hypothetical protein QJQ45_028679 [Haematococcus lacustris]